MNSKTKPQQSSPSSKTTALKDEEERPPSQIHERKKTRANAKSAGGTDTAHDGATQAADDGETSETLDARTKPKQNLLLKLAAKAYAAKRKSNLEERNISSSPPRKSSSETQSSPPRKSADGELYGSKRKKANPGPFYAWPMGLWFSAFFIVPILIIICYSFMTRDVYGSVVAKFTLKAYSQMISPAYGLIFLRTLRITVISTFITIVVALPCGYAMARSRHQTILLILVIIPFLTNSLIRIFAWITILGDNGIVNQFLKLCFNATRKISGNPDAIFKPAKLMFTQKAVILVSIYMYLPYAILPIFTAVDRFDFSLLEAARDLGASKPTAMFKVLIPGIKSGIISALIFTFIPIFGTYTVPNMVGGKDSYMLGNIVVDQVQKVRNWPLASAFSMVLTIISMLGIIWMLYSSKREAELKLISTKEDTQANFAMPSDSAESESVKLQEKLAAKSR